MLSIMCKKGTKITLHSNIVTLQTKIMLFKAKVQFTKLTMKVNKHRSTE